MPERGQFLAPDLGQHIVNPRVRKLAQVVRHEHHAMGRVSIWTQWLIIAAGAVLCPVFVLLTACLIGWLLVRKLRPPPGSTSVNDDAGTVRLGQVRY
jgi:hypothetical protein